MAAILAVVAPSCAGGTGSDTPPDLHVVDAYLAPSQGDIGAAYLTITNDGGADAVVGVRAPGVAERVEMHRSRLDGGLTVMEPADSLPVPADGRLRLQPARDHLMLVGMGAPLQPGDTVHLELSFRRSASQEVDAPVLSYDEIDARLGGTP